MLAPLERLRHRSLKVRRLLFFHPVIIPRIEGTLIRLSASDRNAIVASNRDKSSLWRNLESRMMNRREYLFKKNDNQNLVTEDLEAA